MWSILSHLVTFSISVAVKLVPLSDTIARGIPNIMKKWINIYKTDSVSIF